MTTQMEIEIDQIALDLMRQVRPVLLSGLPLAQKSARAQILIRDAMVRHLNAMVEECANAAEQQDRAGYEWVKDSLWANILRRAGANVRKLTLSALTSTTVTRDNFDFVLGEVSAALNADDP